MRISIWYVGDKKVLAKKAAITTTKQMAKVAAVSILINATGSIVPGIAVAATKGETVDMIDKITRASQPIKDLLTGLADPVCYVVFAWGLLECMLGKGSSGITRMKFATLGYLGMNWIPVFMKMLASARPM